jgi:hypothetical protein
VAGCCKYGDKTPSSGPQIWLVVWLNCDNCDECLVITVGMVTF